MIQIVTSPDLPVTPRELGIQLAPDRVLVPAPIGRVLEQLGATTVHSAISAMQNFPGVFQAACGLPQNDFLAARSGALALLEALHEKPTPRKARKFPFGARPPGEEGE